MQKKRNRSCLTTNQKLPNTRGHGYIASLHTVTGPRASSSSSSSSWSPEGAEATRTSLKLARLLRRPSHSAFHVGQRFASTWRPDFPSSSSSSAIQRKRSWSSFSPKAVSQDNVLPTEGDERFSAHHQAVRRSFGDWLADWDKQKAMGFVEDHSAHFALVDLQKLTIPNAVEPTPLSGFRSQGAQWSPRGRIWRSWQVPLCELLLTRSCGYKVFLGRLQGAHSTPS